MAHTIVMVPEGHTVQVHPPGAVPQPAMPPQPQGMVPNPMADGAKAAMDTVMPKAAPEKPKEKPKAKKPEAKKEPKKD